MIYNIIFNFAQFRCRSRMSLGPAVLQYTLQMSLVPIRRRS